MTHGKKAIQSAIDRILHLFRTTYRGPDALPVYDVDGETGKPLSKRNLLSEFDDYAPFFWVLGEHSMVNDHFLILKTRLQQKPLLFSRPQIRAIKGLGLPGLLRRLPYADSQDYVEILYGLAELYTLSNEDKFLQTAENLFTGIVKNFERNGTIQSFRLMPFGPTLPLADAMSGMFIEIASELSALTKSKLLKQYYLDCASKWMKWWIETDLFQQYGVFPSVAVKGWPRSLPGIREKLSLAELAKPNTSMAYGILALAAPPHLDPIARQVFERWMDGITRCFMTPDGVFGHLAELKGSVNKGPVLSTNFAMLDILCDAVSLFDCKNSKRIAVTITDYFLKFRSPNTGLIPDEPGKERSYLDANSDFAVSLAKMTEITGETKYREAGCSIVDSILKYHSAPYGFYRDVHLHTGKPLSPLVETRFCSLLLKTLYLYRDDIPIYDESGKWSLFRDR
ncbi:MAG: hypothetical protein WBM02_00360 [bacterium]